MLCGEELLINLLYGGITKVVIDGITYVPEAEIKTPDEPNLIRALQSLTEIQYFGECSHKHRAWDAMNALAPELATLSAKSPEAAFNRVRESEDV